MKYFLLTAFLFLAGCASTGLNSKTGLALYTSTVEPVTVASSQGSSRAGYSCTHNILGVAAFGDASIEEAKKNGSVRAVTHVDQHYENIFGFYGRVCTVVYGN